MRRRNCIKNLLSPTGEVLTDPKLLEAMATEYYTNLFATEGVRDMAGVIATIPCRVSPEMNATLTKPFSQEEVKDVNSTSIGIGWISSEVSSAPLGGM